MIDRIDIATVEAEEATTVPAGAFKTLKIVYRFKSTRASSYEERYAPDVRMWVRERPVTGGSKFLDSPREPRRDAC